MSASVIRSTHVERIDLRPELTQHLRQRLQAFREGFRHNLALVGPAGSGKTFKLHQLLQEQPTNLLVIYCPQYRESCRSFLHRFAVTILQAGLTGASEPAGTAGEPRAPLEELLRSAEGRLPKTTAALRSLEGFFGRRLYAEAFNRTLDAIPVLIEERRLPCVLILDEFLFLEELGLGHAFHELGKRVMTWPTTLFILASSFPYRARAILRERLQLLFGQFELLNFDPPDPRHAGAWVRQELGTLRGAKTVSPFLIRWLGVHPWYLSVFLKRIKELAALRQTREVTATLFFQTAWDVLGSPEGILHQWCVSRMESLAHLRLGARAMEALMQIAAGARTATDIGRHLGRAGLPGTLQLLMEHDLVQRKGMCWVIPDPILRCWLVAILSVQRSGSGLGEGAVRARFEQYLSAAWSHWVQSTQLSFSEQVTRLFTNFRDDIVSLDSKTGRLQRFSTVTVQRPAAMQGSAVYLTAEGEGRRWCCTVQEGLVDESTVAHFDAFCRAQVPRPSRKIVITRRGVEDNARLLAKANNMWVWAADDVKVLLDLYGHNP